VSEFLLEIDVILVSEKLIEFLFISSMGTLDLAIELG
jgi:hypothetical protein